MKIALRTSVEVLTNKEKLQSANCQRSTEACTYVWHHQMCSGFSGQKCLHKSKWHFYTSTAVRTALEALCFRSISPFLCPCVRICRKSSSSTKSYFCTTNYCTGSTNIACCLSHMSNLTEHIISCSQLRLHKLS